MNKLKESFKSLSTMYFNILKDLCKMNQLNRFNKTLFKNLYRAGKSIVLDKKWDEETKTIKIKTIELTMKKEYEFIKQQWGTNNVK